MNSEKNTSVKLNYKDNCMPLKNFINLSAKN